MKKYKNLGYLRVLACLGIVCTHLGQKIQITGKPYEFTHYLQHGVYLFFIISGFLAIYTYDVKKYTVKSYWFHRLIRILPVYYAIILYDIVLCQFITKSMPPDEYGMGWLRYILLISHSVPGSMEWRNISFTWTVSVFVLFYILVPLIHKLIRSWRASVIGIGVTYCAMLALEKIYSAIGISRDWGTPLFYIIYFMFGVMIYYAVKENKENKAILIFALLILYYFVFSRYNSPYTLSFLLSIIILSSMNLEFRNAGVQKMFDVVDRYSYEIYLGHAVAMEMIDIIGSRWSMSVPVILIFGIGGTVIVSMFLYHCVDRPVNNMVKKYMK